MSGTPYSPAIHTGLPVDERVSFVGLTDHQFFVHKPYHLDRINQNHTAKYLRPTQDLQWDQPRNKAFGYPVDKYERYRLASLSSQTLTTVHVLGHTIPIPQPLPILLGFKFPVESNAWDWPRLLVHRVPYTSRSKLLSLLAVGIEVTTTKLEARRWQTQCRYWQATSKPAFNKWYTNLWNSRVVQEAENRDFAFGYIVSEHLENLSNNRTIANAFHQPKLSDPVDNVVLHMLPRIGSPLVNPQFNIGWLSVVLNWSVQTPIRLLYLQCLLASQLADYTEAECKFQAIELASQVRMPPYIPAAIEGYTLQRHLQKIEQKLLGQVKWREWYADFDEHYKWDKGLLVIRE